MTRSKSKEYFKYLEKKLPEQLITRVDRYSIQRYWDDGNGRQNELLFYPSKIGWEEIEGYKKLKNPNDKEKYLIYRLDQLVNNKNPYWRDPNAKIKTKKLKLKVKGKTKRASLKVKPKEKKKLKSKRANIKPNHRW